MDLDGGASSEPGVSDGIYIYGPRLTVHFSV